MSRTAVVILNYNGEKLLRQFLPSVLKNSSDAQVIVADNGSTDRSLHVLQSEFPTVTVIRLDHNYGFCGGYNRALQQVDADYYVLLNSDVEVTPDWLAPMQRLMDAHPEIGAIQPKVLSYERRDMFEYAGAGGGYIDSLGYPFCRGRIFDTVEQDRGQYNDERQIFWATGACLMIRSGLYHKFGGLDEDFFAHMEEIDLCWKIQRAGSMVYYCGLSTVFHLGAGTLGYASPRKTYLNFRNGLNLIHKHLGTSELLYKMPLRFGLDWLASILFLLRGQGKHALAVFRGQLDFILGSGRNSQKRKQIRKEYPDYPRKTVFSGLVLVNYFLLGRKTWTSKYQ